MQPPLTPEADEAYYQEAEDPNALQADNWDGVTPNGAPDAWAGTTQQATASVDGSSTGQDVAHFAQEAPGAQDKNLKIQDQADDVDDGAENPEPLSLQLKIKTPQFVDKPNLVGGDQAQKNGIVVPRVVTNQKILER